MQNEAEWSLVYDRFHQDINNPLQPIILHREFYRHTIKIHCQADSIPSTWWTAGWLHHRINDLSLPTPFIAESIRVPINRQYLIELKNVSDKFYLIFYPAKWYLWMNIKIEYWDKGA